MEVSNVICSFLAKNNFTELSGCFDERIICVEKSSKNWYCTEDNTFYYIIMLSTEGCTIWCEISQDIPEDTELVATLVRDVDSSLRSSPSSSITSQAMITTQHGHSQQHSRSAATSPTASSTEANRGKPQRLHADRSQIVLFTATRVEHNAGILFKFLRRFANWLHLF